MKIKGTTFVSGLNSVEVKFLKTLLHLFVHLQAVPVRLLLIVVGCDVNKPQ